MVGMAMGDDGARRRPDRIDEEISGLDVQSLREHLDPGLRDGD